MYGRVPEPWSLRSAAPMVPQTNQIYVCGMYGRLPEPWWLTSAASMVSQTNKIYVCGMYGRAPEPWWLRPAASKVTQTNQIYVYMQIVRGRLGEIYVYIALQASPTSLTNSK